MADERLDDDRIRRLHRQAGDSRSTAAHIAEELWVSLASGTLPAPERTAAFDHIVGCETCRQIWRGVSIFDDQARAEGLGPDTRSASVRRVGAMPWLHVPPVNPRALGLATAAVLLIGFGIVLGRATRPDISAPPQHVATGTPARPAPSSAPAAPVPPAPDEVTRDQLTARSEQVARQAREIAELPRGALESTQAVNVPIVTLEPDALRGSQAIPTIDLASTTSLVVFVLSATDEQRATDYAVELVTEDSRVLWKARGLSRTADATFTFAVPASLLRGGAFRVRLYGLNEERRRLIHEYGFGGGAK